jgi:anti-sigma regulatory factor (Ser/Thr protein kinase)
MTNDSISLEPTLAAPRIARAALRAWLVRDGLENLEDDILLAASELVANAVVHARTTLIVSYAADEEQVELAVTDNDRCPVVVGVESSGETIGRSARPIIMRGRGLQMVQAVADEWGVAEEPAGKQVWARWSTGHIIGQ